MHIYIYTLHTCHSDIYIYTYIVYPNIYIYIYIYIYNLEPYKILRQDGCCQGWDGEWKEGCSLVLHEDCMPLKGELMEGVCVCVWLPIYTCPASYTGARCAREDEGSRKMRRGQDRYCTSVPRLNDVSCSCTFKTTKVDADDDRGGHM